MRRQIVFFFLGGFQKKSQTIPKAEIEKNSNEENGI